MQHKLFDEEPFNFPGRDTPHGVELFLKVTPSASKNRIGKIIDDGQGKFRLCVYVTTPPENNKANLAIIEFLSSLFRIAKSSCQIIAGEHAKQKTLLIHQQNIFAKHYQF